MKRWVALALMMLLTTTAVSAQQLPPGKWWRRGDVVQRLDLSEEQQTRLDGIFRDAANELIDGRAEVEKLTIALRAELDQDQLNRANLQRVAARLSDARGKLFERELMMLVDMRAVLTNPQWSRLRADLERMRAERERPMGRRPTTQRRPQ